MPFRVLVGDCLESLRTLPDRSVHCCVTSPPYWGLRDYGHDGQIGLESSPEQFVAKLVDVFREVRRVLRDDGTLWLNLGDSYNNTDKWGGGGGNTGKHTINWTHGDDSCDHEPVDDDDSGFSAQCVRCIKCGGSGVVESWSTRRKRDALPGLKPKDLIGIPWRVAFALQADGWWIRQDIIWSKPNPMPESVTDRCTKAHEYLFLLTKSERYYYDADAVREPSEGTDPRLKRSPEEVSNGAMRNNNLEMLGTTRGKVNQPCCNPLGRNRRSVWTVDEDELEQFRRWKQEQNRGKSDVWTVATAPYSEAHFATYPPKLIEPCILAGTSERGACSNCGAPWERVVDSSPMVLDRSDRTHKKGRTRSSGTMLAPPRSTTVGWSPACDCEFYRLRDDVPEPIKDELRKLGILEARDERQDVQAVRESV